MKKFKELVHTRTKSFADHTSLHGFRELFYAKKNFDKTVWLIIVLLAFGITTFQVYNSVSQFFQEPTRTVINPAVASKMLYPPVRACYPHWIYWIDWDIAYEMGFSKPAILHGMSFLGTVYSSMFFDADEAGRSFESTMALNNLTKISEFYSAIAKAFSTSNVYADDADDTMFDQVDFVYNNELSTLACYYSTGEYILDRLWANKSTINRLETSLAFEIQDQTYALLSQHLTEQEYGAYMTNWLTEVANYKLFKDEFLTKNFTMVSLPMMMYVNGNDDSSVDIVYTNDWYVISVAASAYVSKNTEHRRCQEGERQIRQTDLVDEVCHAQATRSYCNCQELYHALLIKRDSVENVCRSHIFFIFDNRTEQANGTLPNTQSCFIPKEGVNNFYKCMDSAIKSCELWSYTATATATSIDNVRNVVAKKSTIIYIVYPKPDQIFVSTELDYQTFENFVGSVGGLLGIWTGASVLSFIQLFYLCCLTMFCEESENETVTGSLKRTKSKVALARY